VLLLPDSSPLDPFVVITTWRTRGPGKDTPT
jgi:hypothetical protein